MHIKQVQDAPLLVNVQVEGNTGSLQRRGELEAVFHFYRPVLPGVPDEAGRRRLGHLQFIGKQSDQLGVGVFSEQVVLGSLVRQRPHADHGVTENPEIRPAALLFHRIG